MQKKKIKEIEFKQKMKEFKKCRVKILIINYFGGLLKFELLPCSSRSNYDLLKIMKNKKKT